jgi:hypothetical protein
VSDDLDAWLRDFFDRIRVDPDAAETEFDSYPQETTEMLEAAGGVADWVSARMARYFATERDFDALFRHLDENRGRLRETMQWIDLVNDYGEDLDMAAMQNRRPFMQCIDQYGDPIKSALLERPALRQAYEQEKADEEMYGSWNI